MNSVLNVFMIFFLGLLTSCICVINFFLSTCAYLSHPNALRSISNGTIIVDIIDKCSRWRKACMWLKTRSN